MKVDKQNLEKSQVELTVTLTSEEFAPYLEDATRKIAKETKIDGFRKGKAPLDKVKEKVGEMSILDEASKIAINKTAEEVMKEQLPDAQPVGQPQVNITKLASDNDFEYKIVISLLPEVEIGEYKDLGIKGEEVKVEDKDIEETLKQLAEMRAVEKEVDREIKEGDKVIVDINMYLEGVPVEGGQSQDATIIIGKDYIVPGFDKNLIGAKKGEEKSFDLHMPENHHQTNIAGKNVEFKVNVKGVYEREIPEMDDKMAQTLQFKDLEDLKKALKDNISQEKKQKAEQKAEAELLDKVIENFTFGEVPEVLVQNESKNMRGEIEQSVQQQGAKFEDYLTSINKTEEQLMLDLLPQAVKRVKVALAIREIAKKEDIKVTQEEIDKEIEKIKEAHKDQPEVEEKVNDPQYVHYLNNVLTNQKVISKLKEWNIKE